MHVECNQKDDNNENNNNDNDNSNNNNNNDDNDNDNNNKIILVIKIVIILWRILYYGLETRAMLFYSLNMEASFSGFIIYKTFEKCSGS